MIYAVNKRTKEHRSVTRPDVLSNADWYYIKADANGWIEWSAHDGQPVQDSQLVDVKCSSQHWEDASSIQASDVGWSELSTVTHYRPILDAPKPEWNGEGLPPVGSHVGVIDDGTLRYGADECGPVVAHVEGCAVVRMSYGLGCFKANVLRPGRTDRERWIEAANEAWMANDERKNVYEVLFDAGLARLPGE